MSRFRSQFSISFFLSNEYIRHYLDEIRQLAKHGGVGDWETIWNMPIWLRRTLIAQMNDDHRKQIEEANKQKGTLTDTMDEKAVKMISQRYKEKVDKPGGTYKPKLKRP